MPNEKNELKELLTAVNSLISKLHPAICSNPDYIFFSNQQFCQLMNISKKTASSWRIKKYIPYSKIDRNYYYRFSDVLIMLHNNYTDNF